MNKVKIIAKMSLKRYINTVHILCDECSLEEDKGG